MKDCVHCLYIRLTSTFPGPSGCAGSYSSAVSYSTHSEVIATSNVHNFVTSAQGPLAPASAAIENLSIYMCAPHACVLSH